jgi:ACT domain-containing protein
VIPQTPRRPERAARLSGKFPETLLRKKVLPIMRNRNVHIQFWLNKKEAQALDKLVKKSGLSREAYLRHLINGVVPQDAPSPDYFSMMKELHAIGNNLNQIAQKAHVLNVMDVQRYDENMCLFNQAVKTITNAVLLPRRNE